MEASKLAKEKVNVTGLERSEQTKLKEEERVDGELRVVEEH